MDYSQLSDFEINKRVAEIVIYGDWFLEPTDENPSWFFNLGVEGKNTVKLPDYCNNPADAWPIISDNRISLMYDKSTEEGNEAQWCLASSPCDQHIVDYASESKLLRAAMIVFLMMQDANNA
ncbi:DUF2591 domain-containing protein [Escherichia coli]|nr:DUF2591 domain-containing protein [Escherichia coli]EFN5018056.1 DUF2591 domain-containing protein [Escherichia coli]EFN7786249.1 DUF2591 domain-containing protein [Escherichia coli]EKW3456668.1 DUF2591 family protein [Escherichia coli]